MIAPTEKLKVFISSKCGLERYDSIRSKLQEYIESTGLATVYLFEDKEASSVPAVIHYTFSLEDSDLCIFLIDNKDGVPYGVQKEIDKANKHKIKSLYYFCDEKKKRPTPLQDSLTGAEHVKSKTVHSFDELINRPAIAFLDDLILIYKLYCQNHLIFKKDEDDQETIPTVIGELSSFTSSFSKSVLSNIDECKAYFTRLVFGSDVKAEKTSPLDEYCANFLPVLFESKSIINFNPYMLKAEVKKLHTPEQFIVVE